MKNDFISIYKAIEESEQKAFSHYIGYFHAHQKAVLTVFEEVVNAINKPALPIQTSKNTLNALSDLKKWLLEFLTVQELKNNNSYEAQFLTLEALRKRQLDGAFVQKAKEMTREWARNESPDMWLMLWKMRLVHIQYFNTEVDRLQDHRPQMHELMNELDSFYISGKLKYAVELESRASILQEKYEMRLMNEIVLLIEQDAALSPVIHELYYPLLNLVKNRSKAAFNELKSFFQKKKHGHERVEKLGILLYLLNFAIHQIRQGNTFYINEYLELADIGLKESLFIASGYFPTDTFINIVNLGSSKKQYKWAEDFIKIWSEHLEPKTRNMTTSLALARVYFEQKKFNEVIDLVNLLKERPYKNIAFNVNIRILALRTYYEQDKPNDFILSDINALYQYVNRNESINADMKTSIFRFIKILRGLINKKEKDELINELKKNEPIVYKDWLDEKITARKI
jgi:hypothetical protein